LLALWKKLCEDALKIAQFHGDDPGKLLGHGPQFEAQMALAGGARHGLALNRQAIDAATEGLNRQHEVLQTRLRTEYDYEPGKARKTLQYADVARKVEKELGITWPRTKEREHYSRSQADLAVIDHPFAKLYLEMKEIEGRLRLLQSLPDGPLLLNHAFGAAGRFVSTLPTRQSINALRTVPGVVVPSGDGRLLEARYVNPHLCALAQILLDRYGRSVLADLINAGMDPGKWVATRMTGKSVDGISGRDLLVAQACNVGFPRGLDAKAFRIRSRKEFGVSFSQAEVEPHRTAWLEMFPQVHLYLADRMPLVNRVLVSAGTAPVRWSDGAIREAALEIAFGSRRSEEIDQPYDDELIDWVWSALRAVKACLPLTEEAAVAIRDGMGCEELKRILLTEAIVSPTGRVRGCCEYTQSRETPFNGLVSDGANQALLDLTKEGIRVISTIYDGFLLELPSDTELPVLARRVEDIMFHAMRKFMPNINITVESTLMDRWPTAAQPVSDDPACLEEQLAPQLNGTVAA